MKTCKICNQSKTLENFYFRKDTNSYRMECKSCWGTQRKKYNKNHKKEKKAYDIYRLYGITYIEYNKLLKIQNHRCAICKSKGTNRGLHIDHSHSNGKVRGLLCHHCNTGLGKFKDKEILLKKAINYLRKNG